MLSFGSNQAPLHIPGQFRARLGRGGADLPAVDQALRPHALHEAHSVLSHDALPPPREACCKGPPFSTVHLDAVSSQGFVSRESRDHTILDCPGVPSGLSGVESLQHRRTPPPSAVRVGRTASRLPPLLTGQGLCQDEFLNRVRFVPWHVCV